MDRKEFFHEAFRRLVGKGLELFEGNPVVEKLEEFAQPKHRPPGASKDDAKFRELCTGCDACMAACPVNVVMIDDLEKRYPVIYPETSPCLHCDGYPCIASCPTGALHLHNE